MNTIEKELGDAGITSTEWIRKLVRSSEGDITNAVKLNMWMTIGKFIPEVRKALLEAELPPSELPQPGAAFGTSSIKDAEFKDVCKICGGHKRIKVLGKAEDGTETPIEIDCPVCKSAVPELPKAAGGLRV